MTYSKFNDRNAYERTRYRKRMNMAIEMLGGKCVRCGAFEDLQFDHIDSKYKSFSVTPNWSMALDRWLEEVVKCQLLCAPCHKVKTLNDAETHNRYRYLKHKCRCDICKSDYSAYRKERYRQKKK